MLWVEPGSWFSLDLQDTHLNLEKREKEFLCVRVDTHIFEEIWLEWNADGHCTLEKEEGGLNEHGREIHVYIFSS